MQVNRVGAAAACRLAYAAEALRLAAPGGPVALHSAFGRAILAGGTMRIAVLSDIHANREAFDAVMAAVHAAGVDEIVLLGDLVGYGPDPEYVVERVADMAAAGSVCLLGNHDDAAVNGPQGMSEDARVAIEWTRQRLLPAHLAFLAGLPLSAQSDDRLHVHASADACGLWHYVDCREAAARSLAATSAHTTLCGHTHVPALFSARPGRNPVHFQPLADIPTPLSATMRHVIVVGAVGQPRDGNPAACFGLLDTGERTITMARVPYDLGETARKIGQRGLPERLGMRLMVGR